MALDRVAGKVTTAHLLVLANAGSGMLAFAFHPDTGEGLAISRLRQALVKALGGRRLA